MPKRKTKTKKAAVAGLGKKTAVLSVPASYSFGDLGKKFLVLFLIISLNWFGLATIGKTLSGFSDIEESQDNSFAAGSLDFHLSSPNGWLPPEKVDDLLAGDTVTRTIDVINDGSLPFQYTASTTIFASSDTEFCGALDLKVEHGSDVIYDGSLIDLVFNPTLLLGVGETDTLEFSVTLPDGSPDFDAKTCEFKFVFSGWQENLNWGEVFWDTEELEGNVLETQPIEQAGSVGIGPIADAMVKKQNPNNNYGSQPELEVKSQQAQNRRTFIKFDFNFPDVATINSANLKLYMTLAPNANRQYEAKKAMENWTELDVTWNNQPAIDGAGPTIPTGLTNNVWLGWNVSGDVQNFVSTPANNFGWRIADIEEDADSGNLEAKFFSRENNDVAHRPVLEIAFSAPPATTTHPVINEVYYDVEPGRGNDANNEWVEIYNPTGSDVDISGWKICDNNLCDIIPVSPAIPAKGFAVITNDDSTWGLWPEIPAGAIKIALNSGIGNGLSNNGDKVILKNAADAEIDAMSYGDDTDIFNPSAPDAIQGNSLARLIKGYDVNTAVDWVISHTPNPGTNPSDGGEEVIRFTSEGIEVAASFDELSPLTEASLACPIEETFLTENLQPENSGQSEASFESITVPDSEESGDEPADEEAVSEPADEPVDEIIDEAAGDEPADETVNETASDESADETVGEPADEPVETAGDETAGIAGDEPPEETVVGDTEQDMVAEEVATEPAPAQEPTSGSEPIIEQAETPMIETPAVTAPAETGDAPSPADE